MSELQKDDLAPAELRERVEQIVSRVSRIDASEFEDEVLIREELGIDSLMAMEIIATCEKELSIRIDETLFACVESVGDFMSIMHDLYEDQRAS
ncbi:MAG: acyl carrier protein [Spirochaetaceae bacterium]